MLGGGVYPGMITATIGTALLVAVAVTSVVIVRRRLRYETWYLVHLAAYAGIALAWFHQIPTGNELVLDRVAADYWRALYLATLGLLVAFRVVQPVVNAFRYRMRVAEVVAEGPDVVSVRITGRGLDRLNARAGQFFLWRFLGRGRWWASHPFSLSAAPDRRSLRITVKALGDFSSRLGEIAPGTRVVAEGPFGVFSGAVRQRDKVALIGGGIGITPIRALLEELEGDVVAVYRVVGESDIVFAEELDELVRERDVELHYVVASPSATSSSAGRPQWRAPSRKACGTPACRAAPSTPSASRSEPERRHPRCTGRFPPSSAQPQSRCRQRAPGPRPRRRRPSRRRRSSPRRWSARRCRRTAGAASR